MTEARYDAVASFYADGWSDSYDDAASAALLSVLGDVRGLRVLDVACGHGRYTRELARRGAASVVGVDISAELVGRAEGIEAGEPLGVRYVCADLASPAGAALPGGSVDRVVCGFGLSDVDDLDGALRTVARVLAPGGRFAFSILHPCFPGADDVSGSWPARGRYYDEGHWYAAGAASTLRAQVGANHRTLSTYLNTLVRHGLVPDRVEEPEPEAAWAQRSPAAAAFPVYLVVGSTRAPSYS